MLVEEIIKKGEQMALEGADFETIKKKVDQHKLDKEDRNFVLQKIDELLFHIELQKQDRSKALIQMILGAILMGFPLIIAFYFYDPGSRIIYVWYAFALIGGWILKEGYKKWRTPFEAPENFGYSRKKFNRF